MNARSSYARLLSTGRYLPPHCVSNEELVGQLAVRGIQTSDSWIVERTGICMRHFADPDEPTSMLAYLAAVQAIERAGIDPQSIDGIIVATSTPDSVFPGTACILQNRLGIRNACAAFDVQAVCSGFIYALSVANSLIQSGANKTMLVVGAETFSRLLDFNDRRTCVLFGDGAGAVLLSASDEPGILSSALHADGRYADLLCVPGHIRHGVVSGHPFLQMEGQAVFKLAVKVLESVATEALQKAGLPPSALDWLIPHQANLRIMKSTCRKLGLPEERMIQTVDRHGNTSAASVPLALDVAMQDGRIKRGQHVLMEGVGGGLTWGAITMRI